MYEFLNDVYNIRNVQKFRFFIEEVSKHPRFNELYDVLPHIWKFFKIYYKPWEKRFWEYLNSNDSPNLMIWLHGIYGDTYKFPVPKKLLKKRKTYNLLNHRADAIKIGVCFCPFMEYFDFNSDIRAGVIKNPLQIEDYGRDISRRYDIIRESGSFTELRIFYRHYILTKEFSPFVFSGSGFFFDFFKQTLLKMDFTGVEKIEVRLKNVPSFIRVNPNFSLTFNEGTCEYFYNVVEN